MIPPYFLQIAIGIYLIEVIFILTGTLVTIDSGEDKLEKTNRIGAEFEERNCILFFYCFIIFFGFIWFSFNCS